MLFFKRSVINVHGSPQHCSSSHIQQKAYGSRKKSQNKCYGPDECGHAKPYGVICYPCTDEHVKTEVMRPCGHKDPVVRKNRSQTVNGHDIVRRRTIFCKLPDNNEKITTCKECGNNPSAEYRYESSRWKKHQGAPRNECNSIRTTEKE